MPRNIRILVDDQDAGEGGYRTSAVARPHILVERRWFTPMAFFLAFFCLFWDGFLAIWYGAALHSSRPVAVVALVFPLIHVAVGVSLTYATLCNFVNRTHIGVEREVLSVRHGPLPWIGNRDIPLSDLQQLFCRERVGNRGARTYRLEAMLKSRGTVPLLRGLQQPDQALYLEQFLEQRLGIVDVPVAGEYT